MRNDAEAYQRELAAFRAFGDVGPPPPPANYLAISGGSENGAFGAGLLVGWSDSGTRRGGKLVTGISTGALIGLFALLGSKYGAQLKQGFTQTSGKDACETPDYLTDRRAGRRSLNQEQHMASNSNGSPPQRGPHEMEDGYLGCATGDEPLATLNELLETERAGTRVTLRMTREVPLQIISSGAS